MSPVILVSVSEWGLLGISLVTLGVFLLSQLYDVRTAAMRRRQAAAIRSLRVGVQPEVDVLVKVTDSQPLLKATLQSLARVQYRKLHIFVIDSSDDERTSVLIGTWLRRQKKRSCTYLRVERKRESASWSDADLATYGSTNPSGEYLLCLSAGDVVEPHALKRVVVRAQGTPRIGAYELNTALTGVVTLSRLAPVVLVAWRRLVKKAATVLYVPDRMGPRNHTLYRRAMWERRESLHSFRRRIGFVSDALVFDSSAHVTMREQQGIGTAVGALVSFLLMSYASALAAMLQTASLLGLTWVLVSLWTGLALVSDETLERSTKGFLLSAIPALYFMIYLEMFSLSIIGLWAMMRRILFGLAHLLQLPIFPWFRRLRHA